MKSWLTFNLDRCWKEKNEYYAKAMRTNSSFHILACSNKLGLHNDLSYILYLTETSEACQKYISEKFAV
jgi:hypothetical protein